MFPFGGVPVVPVAPKYYCHQCSSEVETYVENDERVCVQCKETFVEELETPPVQNPPPPPNPLPFNPMNGFPQFFNITNLFNPNLNRSNAPRTDPNQFIQQILNSLTQSFGNGEPMDATNFFQQFGMNVQNNSMEDFLHRLFEEHVHAGPPPADKDVVEKLPRKNITKEQELEEVECAVCKDNFEEGDNVIELPCNHLFHPDCILPWLENVRQYYLII